MTGRLWSGAHALENVLATLWVGGMWITGYMVTPVLFAGLEDRQLAGQLAGQLFSLMSYCGLVAGGGLLILVMLRNRQNWKREWRVWCLVAMLVLVVLSAFVLQPMMQELKSMGLEKDSDQAARFGLLHGLSSTLYLFNSLLGLWLVARGLRPVQNPVT